ncbi:MAG TPA: branched-chain amino acid ABC transporter permease [Thermodesulfobacteriota bacterium]|nr:branched-chain amino acid ABC transporter permease [Thermodesulfobacteriota bacterium]
MDAEIVLQAIVNGLMVGGVYALIAVGLTLIFGVMNVVNFAHGEFVMLGMVMTYLLHLFFGMDPGVSILLVIPVMLGVGALIQKGLISRVIGQPDEAQILLTLGLSVLLTNIALLFMGPDYRSVKTAYKLSVWAVGPILFSVPRLLAFVLAMAFSGTLWLFLTKTDLGKGLRAVAEKPEVAVLMGINPQRMHMLAFGIGISLAAGAGSVLTPFFYTFPSVGGLFVLIAFVVVVLGGMGNIPGAIIGALAIGVTESLTSQFVALDLAMLGVFIIFVLVLVFKPSGILGKGKVY